MESQLIEIDVDDWLVTEPDPAWVAALEAGKVLYFPHLPFQLLPEEAPLLAASARASSASNIRLDQRGHLHGASGATATQLALALMMGRFRQQAQSLVNSLAPKYKEALRLAPTRYRPSRVKTRAGSWRADARRLHVDAFPRRPNHGERILRLFCNINPVGLPCVWRIGEPFGDVARQFLPHAKPYVRWQALVLKNLRLTKSLRSEFDHLMLQLHGGMVANQAYQESAGQMTVPFAAGSVWICFSDQVSHAVMSGQSLLEQTLHLPADQQYDPAASPLAILTAMTGRQLI